METEAAPLREISAGMRGLLVAASVLVFLAGFQLFILTEQTEHYFAWTIQPPLTAAFLGAGYWSSFLLEFLASRERIWARARVAVPAVFAFTTLTLVATLVHFDRFHFGSSEIFARVAAWFWLMIYLVVPPIMLVLWIRQQRLLGVGVFAGHAAWENDFSRIKAGLVSYLAFGLLQLVGLGRFPSSLEWSQLVAWVYLFFMVTVLAVSLYGLASSKSH
jgi:hypothetical protein